VSDRSPIEPLIERRGHLVLDGGLATELEASGHDLDHPLWSARLLLENPGAIAEVHRAYLEAGADCVIASSYQASLPGLAALGLSDERAREVLRLAVRLASDARDAFAEAVSRERRLVAASVGPYGAFLADGSEYRGDYGRVADELRAFHEPRWRVLCDAGADLLACETVPCRIEARVLAELIRETPDRHVWVSFSCRDGARIGDGTPVEDAVSPFAGLASVVAVGINCTDPRHVPALIPRVRAAAPGKRVVVYPNSGETWDGRRRCWTGASDPRDFGEMAQEWKALGATLIGGCCRTGPAHVAAIREALDG
jgi:homocysteine S-methyltransferase